LPNSTLVLVNHPKEIIMGFLAALAPVLEKLLPLLEKLFDKLFDDSSSYNNTMSDEDSSDETKATATDAFLEKVQKELPTSFEGASITTSGDLDSAADVQKLIDQLNEQRADMKAAGSDTTKVDSLIKSLETARDNLETREAAGTSTGDKDFDIKVSPKPGETVIVNPSTTGYSS
jgi:hypothetical protein